MANLNTPPELIRTKRDQVVKHLQWRRKRHIFALSVAGTSAIAAIFWPWSLCVSALLICGIYRPKSVVLDQRTDESTPDFVGAVKQIATIPSLKHFRENDEDVFLTVA